ncbi:MAG: hypothetical protein IT204_25870 [Fimbriimonadaceae bacterium]|nr:hypothetical protein [Fimbriimonadaceae bacterium]
MITLRLAAADLNRLLADLSDPRIEYVGGVFRLTTAVARLRVVATAHLETVDGHLRLAVPFNELRLAGTGGLLGKLASRFWPKWLEPRLEKLIGTRLSAAGLPWDMVWVTAADDPQRGRLGVVNLSPRTLNEWLRSRPGDAPLVPRLVGLTADAAGLALALTLVDRAAPVPPFGALENAT